MHKIVFPRNNRIGIITIPQFIIQRNFSYSLVLNIIYKEIHSKYKKSQGISQCILVD